MDGSENASCPEGALPSPQDAGEPGTGSRASSERGRVRGEAVELLSDMIPAMIWSARADGYIDSFNRRCCDYLGMTSEEMQGDGWMRALLDEDRERVLVEWRQAMDYGLPLEIEFRMRRASDGAYCWHLARALPRRDEQTGKILRWYGTCADIDDLKQAQAARDLLNAELEERVRERTFALAEANARLDKEATLRRRLLDRMVSAQEEERGRISRELHDQTGQYLTGISLELRIIRDILERVRADERGAGMPEDGTRKETPATALIALARLEETARLLSRDVHRMAVCLRPTSLDDLGPLPALRNYIDEWMARQGEGILIDFQHVDLDGPEAVGDRPNGPRVGKQMRTAHWNGMERGFRRRWRPFFSAPFRRR